MNRKAIISALALAAMMLLMGFATVGTIGTSDDGGSRESRATTIDGQYEDNFNSADNLTLWGDAGVVNGDLLVDRASLREEFDRFQLPPWEVVEGNPRIFSGTLRTNGTDMSGSSAKVAIDQHDMEIRFDFTPGFMMTGGPRISVSEGTGITVWGTYSDPKTEAQLWLTNSTGNHSLGTTNAQLIPDQWYSGVLLIQGDDITLEMGPSFIVASHTINGNFTDLTLGVSPRDSAAWDNVTVNRLGGSGTAVTKKVNLPPDTFWSSLSIVYSKDPSTSIELALVNPANGQPFQGLNDITSGYLNLEEKLDPMEVDAVQLRVKLTADGTKSPKVSSWKVMWKGDPPYFIKPIPTVTLNEDEDTVDVIDLRQHFTDRFTDDDNLTFTVPWMSEAQHVMPVADGHMLGFVLGTKDWYGTEYYTVRCSDGTLTVDSVQASVTVMPVDDPPLIRPISRIIVYEDEPYSFDISPHLEDVDTPIEVLKIRAMSDFATVDGHVITLNYDNGGTDRIEILVSDYSNDVTYYLDVTIKGVDDPPVFDPIEMVAMYEDQERTVDITDLISDEDTPIEDLLMDIEGADRYISIEGFIITLFYDDTGGDFQYTVLISDENNTVSQVLDVSVRAVNDVPSVVSVGDMIPVNGIVSWSMTEGDVTDLAIITDDEESVNFQYTVVTDLDGAIMVSNKLRLTAEEGDVGDYTISISISDGAAATIVKVQLEITNRNDPVQDVAIVEPLNGTSVEVGTLITLKGYAFDPDFAFNQELTYTWTSNQDGNLGTGKTLNGVNLTVGFHTVTLEVSDGEYSQQSEFTITVTKAGGGGGGGGGGGNNGGGGVAGGLPVGLIIGIVLAVVVGLVLFVFVRSKGIANPNYVEYADPPEEEEPIPSAAAAYDKPEDGSPRKGIPKTPADEAEALYGEDLKASKAEPKAATGPQTAPVKAPAKPSPEPKPEPEPEPSTKLEGVAVDTASLYEADPEQQRLDRLKREYQAAISALDYGVPSSELAHMDWYELAGAMANGEHKELDDGTPVTKIGDNWYYSDVENLKTFLKRHE
jgi:hypothetical protein